MTQRTLIRGKFIVTIDPALGTISGGEVLIEDGVIAAVGKDLGVSDAEVIDASTQIPRGRPRPDPAGAGSRQSRPGWTAREVGPVFGGPVPRDRAVTASWLVTPQDANPAAGGFDGAGVSYSGR
jgi:hypothetical protein